MPVHWLDYVKRPFAQFISAMSRSQPQRPLSPAPEAADFETEDDFLRERARWVREHGDGSELEGTTRREQNTVNIAEKKTDGNGSFSNYACHPCAGAMLIFSVSFQV